MNPKYPTIPKRLILGAAATLAIASVAYAGTRTISGALHLNHAGVERTIETREPIVLANGTIESLPRGATVRLRERKGDRTIVAELREREGKTELWIQHAGEFRPATPADRAWFASFMKGVNR